MDRIRRILRRQWSFVLGGFVVGIGEAVHYLYFKKFIMVTTGLAWMFSTVEQNLGLGKLVSRFYEPNVHWVIIGALLAAWLVGRLEGESRNWVKYSPGMLLIAFLGGIIFGFGTRVGPGCTTHHIFGGLAVMSIASWTIAIIGLPFAFLTFEAMSRLGFGPYFKHQENRQTVLKSRELGLHDDYRLCLDEDYNPWKDPLRLFASSLIALVVISSLYTGFFGHAKQSLGAGPLLPNIILFVSGLCLGWGIAKAGVGTECGLMAPESLLIKEEHYRKLHIPLVTQRMFTALMPVAGILSAILMLNITVLVMWVLFDWPVPNAVPKPAGWGLHIGHFIAAPCLAAGSVMMIGCEIRSYVRVGLGYLTGIVGMIGFYFGYVPYVLFQQKIDAFIARHTFVRATNIPQLFATTPTGQKVVGAIYTLVLLALFGIVIYFGSRKIGATPREYILKNTDELTLRGEFAEGEARKCAAE